MSAVIEIDPGELRLPPSRNKGPDAAKYQTQVRRYGAGQSKMPFIQVTEGLLGEMMINDGVTRAVRIFNLAAGQTVPVEIIDRRSKADFSHFTRVRDVTPPE